MTNRLRDLSFSAGDRLFALFAVVCGFLYWELPGNHGPGIGGTLLVLVMVAFGWIYTHLKGYKQNKRSFIALTIILLCGLNLFLFDNFVERTLAFLFAQMVYFYWIAVTTGKTVENKLSLYTLLEMVRKIVIVPFGNFGGLPATFLYGGREKGTGKRALMILLGLLLAIPLVIGVTGLLVSADAAFARMMILLPMRLSGELVTYIIQFILGIPVAFYLYGYLLGETRSRYALIKRESMDLAATQIAVIPGGIVYTVLISLSVIYLLFFSVQAASLFGAFFHRLPEGLTYAEYARGGFFQLCQVVIINGILCGISYAFIRERQAKMFRVLMAMMASFTMLLCITAMSKMAMYIESYGLTQLRVYTFWFMVVVFLIFAVVLMRQFITFNGTKIAAIAFVLCFMVLIYGNVDGQIAKYNVERYKEGTLKEMDMGAMVNLSAGAAPYLVEAYGFTDDDILKENIRYTLERYENNYGRNWQSYNLQKSHVAIPKGL